MKTVTTVFKLLESAVVLLKLMRNAAQAPNAKQKLQIANHTAPLHWILSLNKKNSSNICSAHTSNNQLKNSSVNHST